MSHLQEFLNTLKVSLPSICRDSDLVKNIPDVFGSLSTISRMRSKGNVPPHFFIGGHAFYLSDDVVDWVKSQYTDSKETINAGEKNAFQRRK